MENETCHVAERQQPRHHDRDSSYSNFLATHPPVFSYATNPLEADSWLRTIESKFSLLHCTHRNNSKAHLEPSGPRTLPHYLLIITSHGVSSTLSSTLIAYLKVCSIASSKSSWSSSKGTTSCSTIQGSSIPLPNMGHTILIRMRRKPTSTV
jgi:hypothetical protein